MNLRKINNMADDFTNFEGFDGQYDRYDGDPALGYTGYGDDFLDFNGKDLDFAREIGTDRVFTVTINNTTAATEVITFCPSFAPLGGSFRQAVEGVIVAGVTGTGSPKPVDMFTAWVNLNPTRVLAMRVTSNNAAQLAQTVYVVKRSPFRDLQSELIPLSSYTTEFANNDKMVTVRREFQMDNQTVVYCNVPANTQTSFTFYCGAVINTAAALNKKAARAGRNPEVASVKAQLANK